MTNLGPARRALISLSDKSGIDRLADKILPEMERAAPAPPAAANSTVPVFSPEETLSPVNQPAPAAPGPR